jgi:hypothetical protein
MERFLRTYTNAILFCCLFISSAIPAVASWKFIIYGDTRTNDAAHRSVLHAIATHSSDYAFIINVGDVVNDGSSITDWSTWQQAVTNELGTTGQASAPPKYMAAPGNHDAVPGAGAVNWTTFLSGQAAQFGHTGRYFTFDYNNARFIVLNSVEPLDGEQLNLLQNAVEGNTQTWFFAVWHHPIFDFGPKVYEANIHTTWGVPLYQSGCDIIFTGHAHYYVRSKKLKLDGSAHPPLDPIIGTAHIVTGNGGAPLYAVDESHDGNEYLIEYSYDVSQPGYYGYTELTVEGTALTLRHIRADGAVMDSAVYSANAKPLSVAPTGTATPSPTISHSSGVQVFPNPSEQRLYFRFQSPIAEEVKVEMYNISGDRVARVTKLMTPAQGDIVLDISKLPAGIYLYKITQGGYLLQSGKVALRRGS